MILNVSSPIPQMDGIRDNLADDHDKLIYTFRSEYAEEDIFETLEEIFADKTVVAGTALVSRVRTEPPSNVHDCVVEVKVADAKKFCWPELKGINEKVLKEIKKVKKKGFHSHHI